MTDELRLNVDLLKRFEEGLNLRRPDRSAIPARVISGSSIATALVIDGGESPGLTLRRLPIFLSGAEVERYEATHRRYVRALGERIGIRILPESLVHFTVEGRGYEAVYIAQKALPEDTTGDLLIFRLSPEDCCRFVSGVLQEAARVFDFNCAHEGELELGLNGQLSAWAIDGFDPDSPALPERPSLYYLDTSLPIMRRRGQEELHPDFLIRTVPALLLPLARRMFVPDLVARYYNFRRLAVDLIAGFHNEGRSDLVPLLVDSVNWFFLAERQELGFKPITGEEVGTYHRRAAWLDRLGFTMRKVDRRVHQMRGKVYRHILPSHPRR